MITSFLAFFSNDSAQFRKRLKSHLFVGEIEATTLSDVLLLVKYTQSLTYALTSLK